ncbi:transposase domain-containing protein [Acinetobacter sp. ANC 3791]|uniref:transposase domain-containing protein n=1 Tax=Acinetobacter sp. ANC 3791 TaxID=2529836 RepID=UPI003A4C805F
MTLSQDLDLTLQQSSSTLDKFSHMIDFNWIKECLNQTGKSSIRKRKLPAEHVVWLVIGLALFRDLMLPPEFIHTVPILNEIS